MECVNVSIANLVRDRGLSLPDLKNSSLEIQKDQSSRELLYIIRLLVHKMTLLCLEVGKSNKQTINHSLGLISNQEQLVFHKHIMVVYKGKDWLLLVLLMFKHQLFLMPCKG